MDICFKSEKYKIGGCIRFGVCHDADQRHVQAKAWLDEVYYPLVGNYQERYWSIVKIKTVLQEANVSLLLYDMM
jgi:hypothetical protein